MAVNVVPIADSVAGGTLSGRSLAAIERALILDAVWSSRVEVLRSTGLESLDAQREEFTALMDDLQGSFRDACVELRTFRPLLDSLSDGDLEGAMGVLAEYSAEFAEAGRRMFEEQITDVGVRGAGVLACDYLLEEESETQAVLRSKYETLMSGELPNPGLPKSVKCALYLAGLAAAGATIVASHGVLAIVGAAGGPATGAVLAWEKSGCPECWHTITRGRFG